MISLISCAGVVLPAGNNDRNCLHLEVSCVFGSWAEDRADYYSRQVKNTLKCFQVGVFPHLSEIIDNRMLRYFEMPILTNVRRRSRRRVSRILLEFEMEDTKN